LFKFLATEGGINSGINKDVILTNLYPANPGLSLKFETHPVKSLELLDPPPDMCIVLNLVYYK